MLFALRLSKSSRFDGASILVVATQGCRLLSAEYRTRRDPRNVGTACYQTVRIADGRIARSLLIKRRPRFRAVAAIMRSGISGTSDRGTSATAFATSAVKVPDQPMSIGDGIGH